MISPSKRLSRVHRIFDPYKDRRNFVRLDRNEDPAGWEAPHFSRVMASITPADLAAYSDSTVFAAKLADWLRVPAEQLYITAGSDAAIKNIFEAYVDRNDVVVMQNPSWRMYEVYNDVYRGKAVPVDYGRDLRFDHRQVLAQLRERVVRLVILANPNQPTGTLMSGEQLHDIVAMANEHDTLVVVDEAYHLFTPETCIELTQRYSNLIVVRTFSKAFGLASLRLGYCVAHPQRIKDLMLLRPVTDANGLALKIGEYALAHMEWIHERIQAMIEGRDYLYDQLRQRQARTFRSHANFLLVQYDSLEHAKAVIAGVQEHHYLLKGPFGFAPLENTVRITVGPKSLMMKFWQDCGEILCSRTVR